MIARCSPAVAALVAFAIAGCGLGAGEDAGEVSLTITRDYGTGQELRRTIDDVTESDTVLRVLDRSAETTTRYGGGFIESIDGLEGDRRGGRFFDWFFYVNGVESSIGAADFALEGGERIWWDHRDWTAAMRVPAVVGSFPEPFAGGYEGEPHPTAVVCRTSTSLCTRVEVALRQAGARFAPRDEDAIRVLVGPWARLRADPVAARLERGPQYSGVFADFLPTAGGIRLAGLTTEGVAARRFGPAIGLIAATRRNEQPPLWLLTGVSEAGVRAAVVALDPAKLRDHYAVASDRGAPIPLPLR